MNSAKFRIGRLVLYYVLVSLFLFVSGNLGQYLIKNHGMNREMGMLLQGVIFTGLTLIFLFILKRKNPDVFKNIGLKGIHTKSKFIVGIALPLILLVLGILSAYLFGGIENISFNITSSVLIAILINTVTAFLYEAFPEEVFIRGLIFEELQKKFGFTASLFIQPLIFICVPILVVALAALFLGEPFALTIDYFVLLYMFGVALQLYREYTGSLWMSIIFHVIYLEAARYISSGGAYNSEIALIQFEEIFGGFMMLYLSFLFIVILSIVALTILLMMEERKKQGDGSRVSF